MKEEKTAHCSPVTVLVLGAAPVTSMTKRDRSTTLEWSFCTSASDMATDRKSGCETKSAVGVRAFQDTNGRRQVVDPHWKHHVKEEHETTFMVSCGTHATMVDKHHGIEWQNDVCEPVSHENVCAPDARLTLWCGFQWAVSNNCTESDSPGSASHVVGWQNPLRSCPPSCVTINPPLPTSTMQTLPSGARTSPQASVFRLATGASTR